MKTLLLCMPFCCAGEQAPVVDYIAPALAVPDAALTPVVEHVALVVELIVPMVEHIAPVPSVRAEHAHVDVCIAPAPAVAYTAQAPVYECNASDPALVLSSMRHLFLPTTTTPRCWTLSRPSISQWGRSLMFLRLLRLLQLAQRLLQVTVCNSIVKPKNPWLTELPLSYLPKTRQAARLPKR